MEIFRGPHGARAGQSVKGATQRVPARTSDHKGTDPQTEGREYGHYCLARGKDSRQKQGNSSPFLGDQTGKSHAAEHSGAFEGEEAKSPIN